MVNLFLFLALAFAFTFSFGKLLEYIKVPWIFAALILGAVLSEFNPFVEITDSAVFENLATFGMYFLLFMVGMDFDLADLKKKSRFILGSSFFIIFFEALIGGLLIHYGLDYGWAISFLVALSFATVGEAMLAPILREYKLTKTKLGRSIIEIGVTSNIIELGLLILVVQVISHRPLNEVLIIMFSLFFLFVLTVGFRQLKSQSQQLKFKNLETLFFFVILVFLFFVGIGWYAGAAPIGAILAGIAAKTFIPSGRLEAIESEISTMAYGFFVPIFFLWVGIGVDFSALYVYPGLILIIILATSATKILGAYTIAYRELGPKRSFLLGLGLTVRFSTSVVIVKILFDNGLIGADLYSIIIASSIILKLFVPLVFSRLVVRWGIDRKLNVKTILN